MRKSYTENIIRREIKRSGREIAFIREEHDKYGEPTGNELTFNINCLVHSSFSYISKTENENTSKRAVKTTQLMFFGQHEIMPVVNDIVILNSVKYIVNGMQTYAEFENIYDVSLRLEDGGGIV